MCNKNSWACLWQWHGLSSVMKRPIESVFPERVPDNLRKTLTYYIQPRQLSSQSPLHFLWSKSGITEGHFIPNHFVPLVSRTEMQISEGAVFLIFLFLLWTVNQTATIHVIFYDQNKWRERIGVFIIANLQVPRMKCQTTLVLTVMVGSGMSNST